MHWPQDKNSLECTQETESICN
uniref:Uncharacterized protein n=1 Tax=Anguilla anguilla TaxID=7936 RepID=A0A0E9QVB5_ANGAN